MGIRVKAKMTGPMVFYGGSRKRPGEQFEIKSMKELNSGMELVKDDTAAPSNEPQNDPPKEF